MLVLNNVSNNDTSYVNKRSKFLSSLFLRQEKGSVIFCACGVNYENISSIVLPEIVQK